MKKKLFIGYLICLAALFCGCAGFHINDLPTAIEENEPATTVTLLPEVVPSTIAASPTPTPLTTSGYVTQCIVAEEAMPAKFLSAGQIVLSSTEDDDDQFYSLKSDSNKIIPFFDAHPLGNEIISPDGQWLAYMITKDDDAGNEQYFIEIVSFDAKRYALIKVDSSWRVLQNWVNNHQIAIDAINLETVLFDVFANETRKFDFSSQAFSRDVGSATYFPPSLEQVIYYRKASGEYDSIVLWSFLTQSEIWRGHIRPDQTWQILVHWAPRGTRFAAALPTECKTCYDHRMVLSELFVVDQNGRETQVTHLRDNGFKEGEIDQPQWSPDERYIAFWFNGSLMVYDSLTKSTTDYCLKSSDAMGFEPLWSPDSQQIAFNDRDDTGERRVIVVDILTNKAITITNHYLVGWMVTEP